MKAKGSSVILCLLLSMCIVACGSAAPAPSPTAAPTPSLSPAPAPAASPAPTAEPSPSPAITPEKLEALAAALNEELRIADEKAEQEALAQHRQEAGEDGSEIRTEKNVFMHYVVTDDGRISLNLCDRFISAVVQQYLDAPESPDATSLLDLYNQYIQLLPQLGTVTAADVAARLPGVETMIALYADTDFQFRLAQAENGKIVYDSLSAPDDGAPSPTPAA